MTATFDGSSRRAPSDRTAAALVLTASTAVLAGAFFMQYARGLAPCELCVWQRWPYVAAILLTGVAVWAAPRHPLRARWALALAAAALLCGAGIAAMHVGVENGWWKGLTACSGASAGAGDLDSLRAELMATPLVRCDAVPWSLFGLSLAGYNFLIAMGLAAFAGASALGVGQPSRQNARKRAVGAEESRR